MAATPHGLFPGARRVLLMPALGGGKCSHIAGRKKIRGRPTGPLRPSSAALFLTVGELSTRWFRLEPDQSPLPACRPRPPHPAAAPLFPPATPPFPAKWAHVKTYFWSFFNPRGHGCLLPSAARQSPVPQAVQHLLSPRGESPSPAIQFFARCSARRGVERLPNPSSNFAYRGFSSRVAPPGRDGAFPRPLVDVSSMPRLEGSDVNIASPWLEDSAAPLVGLGRKNSRPLASGAVPSRPTAVLFPGLVGGRRGARSLAIGALLDRRSENFRSPFPLWPTKRGA